MDNVVFENCISDPCAELDAGFPSFVEGNHLRHRLAPKRDNQRLACGLNPFNQLDAPRLKLGDQNPFHPALSTAI